MSSEPGLAGTSAESAPVLLEREFDVVLAGLLTIVCAPLVALLAALIRLDSPGPAFIRQPRIGRSGELFRMWKLRTMAADSDPAYHKATVRRLIQGVGTEQGENAAWLSPSDDPRVTRVGRKLRNAGLDELPQLINVLKGEMSLVGPRPALPYEVPLWKEWHHARLAVRPGITGLWQVSARGTADFDAMVRLDLDYIARRSIALDVWIMVMTPGAAWRTARRARSGDADLNATDGTARDAPRLIPGPGPGPGTGPGTNPGLLAIENDPIVNDRM